MGRHYTRYREVVKLLHSHVVTEGDRPTLADIGCGSGYGTNMLRVEMPDFAVYGVEPDDTARAYSRIQYPDIEVYNDIPEGKQDPEIVVMVESVEHMTATEMKYYLFGAQFAVITTPLVANPNNEYHEQSFKTKEDVREHLAKASMQVVTEKIFHGITFTTGERGSQYIGAFRKVKAE